MKKITLLAMIVFTSSFCSQIFAMEIVVQALYKGGAVLMIDGRQRTVKVGKRSPEGVLLVSSTSQSAVLDIDGDKQTVEVSKGISTSFSKAKKNEVRLASGQGGHFFTPGRINGIAVDFLVDTGATSVAMNLPTAKRIGLNYRAGKPIVMSTANGKVTAYQVMLQSVRVGSVEVKNVEATITMGDFPEEILLGNAYLNRVEMRRENGVLVLESRY